MAIYTTLIPLIKEHGPFKLLVILQTIPSVVLKFSLCKSFTSFNLFQDSFEASVVSIIIFLSTHVLNFCWYRSPKVAIIKIQDDQIAGTISQDI